MIEIQVYVNSDFAGFIKKTNFFNPPFKISSSH